MSIRVDVSGNSSSIIIDGGNYIQLNRQVYGAAQNAVIRFLREDQIQELVRIAKNLVRKTKIFCLITSINTTSLAILALTVRGSNVTWQKVQLGVAIPLSLASAVTGWKGIKAKMEYDSYINLLNQNPNARNNELFEKERDSMEYCLRCFYLCELVLSLVGLFNCIVTLPLVPSDQRSYKGIDAYDFYAMALGVVTLPCIYYAAYYDKTNADKLARQQRAIPFQDQSAPPPAYEDP